MNKTEINKKIASFLFKLMITISGDQKYKVIDEKGNEFDLPDYHDDLDACLSIIDYFKRKGYFVSIGYVINNNDLYWSTKISKNNSIYDSNLRKTISESICYAALAFIMKKTQKKNQDSTPLSNIVSVDFKKQ